MSLWRRLDLRVSRSARRWRRLARHSFRESSQFSFEGDQAIFNPANVFRFGSTVFVLLISPTPSGSGRSFPRCFAQCVDLFGVNSPCVAIPNVPSPALRPSEAPCDVADQRLDMRAGGSRTGKFFNQNRRFDRRRHFGLLRRKIGHLQTPLRDSDRRKGETLAFGTSRLRRLARTQRPCGSAPCRTRFRLRTNSRTG